MLSLFCGLHTADESALGRFDYLTMSQQALMEAVLEHSTLKKQFQDEKGNFLDLSEWKGVTMDEASQKVTKVNLKPADADEDGGSIDLAALAPSVVSFKFRRCGITGTIDLTSLPDGLEQLDGRRNNITGTVDLTQLPGTLKKLLLSNNQITGAPDLTRLPESLKLLRLSDNELSGVADLRLLPDGLDWLHMDENELSFLIDFNRPCHALNSFYFANRMVTERDEVYEMDYSDYEESSDDDA